MKTARVTVHPHVRGDHVVAQEPDTTNGRFIPTCVGTTTLAFSQSPKLPVHPHVRGDHDSPVPGSCS